MRTDDAPAVFTSMLHAIDARDWQRVRDAFDTEIDIDYESLFGEKPRRVNADRHCAGWQVFAGPFQATQHITGPFTVQASSDGAIADTHVRAYHRIEGAPGGDVWVVVGHYRVDLRPVNGAWKIRGIKLTVFYQEGNRRIPQFAQDAIKAT